MNAFRTLSFVVLSSLGVASCAKQSEGERCDEEYGGDSDCEGNLICVSAQYLKGEADRCCPAEGESYSDKRCKRFIDTGLDTTAGTGGADGTGGTAGASGNAGHASIVGDVGIAGASGAGAAGSPDSPTVECRYTSDCDASLICGPTGVCQPECAEDRDCDAPSLCDADTQTCVDPAE